VKRFAALLSSARGLLAEGAVGADFRARFDDLHPEATPRERARLAQKLRPEFGVLGHALHDPNRYRSCNVAASVLERHPNRDTIVAVKRTPLCASCGYNRQGRCGLMNAVIAKNAASLPATTVRPTVAALLRRETIETPEAERIAAARITPSRKVAALHLRARLTPPDTSAADVQVRADAVRFGALVDPIPASPIITPGVRRNRARAASASRDPATVERQPGDCREERRSRDLAATLKSPGLTIDPAPRYEPGGRSLAITASPHLTLPARERRSRRASVLENDLVLFRRTFERTLVSVRKRFASGRMTAKRAAACLEVLEEAPIHGIRPTRAARHLIGQLALFAGRPGG
jgi:hypothetical protein